ncbi:MAG: hypothetical protein WC343_13310, partial [Bacilli bacterium]
LNVSDPVDAAPLTQGRRPLLAHRIGAGVTDPIVRRLRAAGAAGSCLAVHAARQTCLAGCVALGRNNNAAKSSTLDAGSRPWLAGSGTGAGKIVFVHDSSSVRVASPREIHASQTIRARGSRIPRSSALVMLPWCVMPAPLGSCARSGQPQPPLVARSRCRCSQVTGDTHSPTSVRA